MCVFVSGPKQSRKLGLGLLRSAISCLRQIHWPRQTVALDQYSCGSKLMGISEVLSNDILLQQKDFRIVNTKALIELVNGLKHPSLHLRNSLLVYLCCMVHKMTLIMTFFLQGPRSSVLKRWKPS